MLYSNSLNDLASSSEKNLIVDILQEDCVPQHFCKNFENDLTAPPTQFFPFLSNINASTSIKNTATTTLNQNNKYYLNQTEKEEKFCSDNGSCWWFLPPPNSTYNSPSDSISSPEKNISSPDSNISNNSSCKVFGGNEQNSFELEKNNEIPLEDWELTRLTVRELNQKLAGQDRSIVSALKQKRRTLKNRGYALNCRARRLKNQQQLEEENARLKIIINQQANLLAEYERKLGRETQQLQFVERSKFY
uniref:Basic leucine zipper domain-containing protein n=1 Tax=Meloidogyne incognita TaxID=6306 RepID=A0A914KIG9_MELIC